MGTDGTALIMGKDENDEYTLEAEIKYHNEAVTRLMEQIGQDKTQPVTYTDDLVTGKYWDKHELASLREVAFGDPLGNNITVGIAENALIDGWRYVEKIGDIDEVSAAKAIHLDFEQCHAKYWLTQALINERIFGAALLYTGNSTFRHDIMTPEENNALDVFSPEYYELPVAKYDKMGRPTKVILRPNPEDQAKTKEPDYDDFIHIFTRPIGRSYKGYSALYSVWSYITLIRHSAYNLGWAMQKFGTGALLIFLSGRLTPDTEASLQTMLQNATQQRAGVVDANLVDRIEYIGASGSFSNNIPECIKTFTSFVTAGSRIPSAILMGESTGTSAGGQIDDKYYHSSISKIQQSMVKYIKELARRRGHPTDWQIDFNAVYAKDARESAEIRVLEANAASAEADAILKEKQAERGDIMVNFQSSQAEKEPKDEEKDNNPAGLN